MAKPKKAVLSTSTLPYKPPFKEVSLVYWKDAYVTTDDNPKLDHADDLTISIGVIVEETSEEITISSFWDGIGESFSSPFQVIPKGMVKHIKRLKCERSKGT
jgi:hypothetical protein